mmetsp:Transcript_25437/g.37474  ORF Transcript_25437/g.37474 Transcript_25437/m.37474 type:complete len:351 (-) Transcript_25437:45-1097(-)|eukprot:scaffold25556_cov144-Skeletonema_dohrnii-CCMP3373.AAC.5
MPDYDHYDNFYVIQLRDLCKQRGLDKTGRKHVLINRLLENDNETSNAGDTAVDDDRQPDQVSSTRDDAPATPGGGELRQLTVAVATGQQVLTAAMAEHSGQLAEHSQQFVGLSEQFNQHHDVSNRQITGMLQNLHHLQGQQNVQGVRLDQYGQRLTAAEGDVNEIREGQGVQEGRITALEHTNRETRIMVEQVYTAQKASKGKNSLLLGPNSDPLTRTGSIFATPPTRPIGTDIDGDAAAGGVPFQGAQKDLFGEGSDLKDTPESTVSNLPDATVPNEDLSDNFERLHLSDANGANSDCYTCSGDGNVLGDKNQWYVCQTCAGSGKLRVLFKKGCLICKSDRGCENCRAR